PLVSVILRQVGPACRAGPLRSANCLKVPLGKRDLLPLVFSFLLNSLLRPHQPTAVVGRLRLRCWRHTGWLRRRRPRPRGRCWLWRLIRSRRRRLGRPIARPETTGGALALQFRADRLLPAAQAVEELRRLRRRG